MRIAAVSDIHYPAGGRQRLAAIARAIGRARPDVLVLGGDLPTFGLDNTAAVMAAFDGLDCPRLFCAGNHDLWTEGGEQTRAQYERTLSELSRAHGFGYLDAGPLQVGEVGFLGCLGWYDYSLRQTAEPTPGVRVSPARPLRRSSFTHLEVLADREDLRWQELEEADYAGKALVWKESGQTRTLVWNDAVYMDWGCSDAEVVEEQVARLRKAYSQLGGAQRLVAVTHTVPFAEAFERPYTKVEWAFCRAYMGSARLGEALEGDGRLAVWIVGHVHYQVVVRCRGVLVVNVSCAPEQRGAGPTLVVLDGDHVDVQRLAL